MECNNKINNLAGCNCTYSCDKKGICCECLRYHRSKGEMPACYFPNDAEKTFNRSIDYYIKIYEKQF